MDDQERKAFERFVPSELRGRPLEFEYYVFWSTHEEPTEKERRAGVYLVEDAEATYLRKFIDPLYESVGIGISPSDDEIISGNKLDSLANAVALAIENVKVQPKKWNVIVGYEFIPFQIEHGEAIVRTASQESLLEFLQKVISIIGQAQEANGYVHFGGGG